MLARLRKIDPRLRRFATSPNRRRFATSSNRQASCGEKVEFSANLDGKVPTQMSTLLLGKQVYELLKYMETLGEVWNLDVVLGSTLRILVHRSSL